MESIARDNHTLKAESEYRDPEPEKSLGLTLRSLAELAQLVDLIGEESPNTDGPVGAESEPAEPGALASLDDLLVFLVQAERELADAESLDAEARGEATRLLAEHDAALAHLRLAEGTADRARGLLSRAQTLLATAFAEEATVRVEALQAKARRVLAEAEREVTTARRAAESLATRPEVRKLLAERATREAADKASRENVARLEALASAVEEARSLGDRRMFREALSLLGPLVEELPEEPALRSLADRLAREARAHHTYQAQLVLQGAHRTLRRSPEEAVRLVEEVDFTDLDDDLARRLFGAWLKATRRLGIPGLLRHCPALHQGAVLRPVEGAQPGALEVVSAVGGISLRKGQVVLAHKLRRLRVVAEEEPG
jgi:hypothetical protein